MDKFTQLAVTSGQHAERLEDLEAVTAATNAGLTKIGSELAKLKNILIFAIGVGLLNTDFVAHLIK